MLPSNQMELFMTVKTMQDIHDRIEAMDEEEERSPADETEVRPEEETTTEDVKVVTESQIEEEVIEETPEEVVEAAPEESDVVEEDTTEVVDYTANLKYKAMKEEYELPDYLAAVIDSPEKEEEIKKIYSKAKGMDHFATRNETLKSQLDSVQPVMQDVQMFNKMVDDKKYHSALKLTGMADDDILRVASDIINLRELTPEEQVAYNTNIQSNQRLHHLEVENQRLQQQFNTNNESKQLNELEAAIVHEGTAEISSGYDQRAGKKGAFRSAVINHAAMIEYQTKNNPNGPTILSPTDAVQSYMDTMGFVAPQSQTGNEGITTPTDGKPTVIVRKDRPTIPNIRSGNKNPVKKKVRRLSDLHALAEGLDDY